MAMPVAAKKPRYTTLFTTQASVYTPTPVEENEARASLDQLRGLLPSHIDPEKDPTRVYVVANLAVPGLVNLNDDAVSITDGLRIYRHFEGQQCNIEHNRGDIVGFIIKAGLSEFGTNRLITEEEARAANKPFNIVTVAAIWRVADPDLVDYILGTAMPGSPDKDKLSLSFEVGFDDYDVMVLPRDTTNIAQASLVVTPDSDGFERYDKMLRVKKGRGVTKDGDRVVRTLVGDIVPLGQGIVTTPAAAVKGLEAIVVNPHAPEETTQADSGYSFSSTQLTLSKADAQPFIDFTTAIPDEDLYPDEADGGREMETHCTVCYGLEGIDPAPVQAAVAGHPPITIRLGAITAFENADRPYDVIKVDVDSDALSALHERIKTATATKTKWPVFHGHVTLAYLKKGAAAKYVGDTRFAGREMTFSSLTFSPHTGNRMEIPFEGAIGTHQIAAQQVYEDEDDLMASSRFIKLTAGWQDKLAALKAANQTLASVSLTLSDGRTVLAKVLDVSTVEATDEISMSGVVITNMTPGVGPQNDDGRDSIPRIGDVFPSHDSDARAAEQAREAARIAATTQPYEGKTADQIAAQGVDATKDMKDNAKAAVITVDVEVSKASVEAALDQINSIFQLSEKRLAAFAATITSTTSVSPSTLPTQPMKLEDLKQTIASVKTVEALPAAMANVALFAEEIMKASEQHAQARKDAEAAAATATTSLAEIKAQLTTLTTQHNELVAAQAAAAAQAQFNERMASVNDVFTFDDESRKDIVAEIKACSDDASFTTWMTRAKRLYKAFAKTAVAEFPPKKDAEDKKDGGKDEDKEDCKAAAQIAIASAKANVIDAPVGDTLAPAGGESLTDRYARVFGTVTIAGRTISELTASAKK